LYIVVGYVVVHCSRLCMVLSCAPVDCYTVCTCALFQAMQLCIVSNKFAQEVRLVVKDEEQSSVEPDITGLGEWYLYRHVDFQEKIIDRIYEGSDAKHSVVVARCYASRRVGFYIWNIIVLMVGITISTFGSSLFCITLLISSVVILMTNYIMSHHESQCHE